MKQKSKKLPKGAQDAKATAGAMIAACRGRGGRHVDRKKRDNKKACRGRDDRV